MALIINSTLLRLAAYIENELGRGDSTPRDDTLLKLAVTTLRPEIIKGITIDSVVDTLDEASVCAQTSAMCIFGLRGLQNRMKVSLMILVGNRLYGLSLTQLIRHKKLRVRTETIEGLRVLKDADLTLDYKNILRRIPGTDHRKINYKFNLTDVKKP